MSNMPTKQYLFLQGVATPFFSRLGEALISQGHSVLCINFCGGDQLFTRHLPQIAFTAPVGQLPAWLTHVIQTHQITHVVLFGDTRPVHTAALDVIRKQGLTVYVFEEGYFRPNWITLEENGVNGYSALQGKSPDFWHQQAQAITVEASPKSAVQSFLHRAYFDFSYRLANAVLHFKFRHYPTHRPYPGHKEYLGWAWRLSCNKLWYQRRDSRLIDTLKTRQTPFYLLPLQLESDAQIRVHSPFNYVGEVIEKTIKSFVEHAPEDSLLIIKNHPLATGLPHHGRTIRRLNRQYGTCKRVFFIETGDLVTLLRHTRGTVLVNSTTATLAMQLKSPVIALGTALFNLPGLTFQGPLDQFWHQASPPDPVLFKNFRRTLIHLTQINGDFYSEDGIKMAIEGSLKAFEKRSSERSADDA